MTFQEASTSETINPVPFVTETQSSNNLDSTSQSNKEVESKPERPLSPLLPPLFLSLELKKTKLILAILFAFESVRSPFKLYPDFSDR